jgi:glycosyltransferase involved in cell wall biosynthesis
MVLGLSKALMELGHTVTLAVFQNQRNPHLEIVDRARESDLGVVILPCRGQIDFSTMGRLTDCIRSLDVDLIHTHGYKASLYALAANRSPRRPMVATCHNWTREILSVRLYGAVERHCLRWFDLVFCVAETTRQVLLKSGISPEKAIVIPNGIEVERFAGGSASLSGQIPPNATVIGMVGRLAAEKGFDRVIQVAPNFLERFPQSYFVLVGDGPKREELMHLTDRLGVKSRVLFAGRREDMPDVYRSFDMMVLPSLNEGMSMTVLEAMAAGVPVVASRVGAMPDFVDHGRTGLLVEPDDPDGTQHAIETLLGNPELRGRLSQAAQEWVASHASVAITANQYLRHYQKQVGVN